MDGGLTGPSLVFRLYLPLPVTAKWSRRLRDQHSSVDCWQTGTSLP